MGRAERIKTLLNDFKQEGFNRGDEITVATTERRGAKQ